MSLLKRRSFLRNAALAGAAVGSQLAWHDAIRAAAPAIQNSGKSCIFLYMNGAPSQFETFDPKAATRSETDSIPTNVAGVRFAEDLPKLSQQAHRMCLMRSVFSREGSHPRAQYLMQSGYQPLGGAGHPHVGAHVAQQLERDSTQLPGYIKFSIGGRRGGAGSLGGGALGVRYNPLTVSTPGKLPDNTNLTVDDKRFRRRIGLLQGLDSANGHRQLQREVAGHVDLVQSAQKMVTSRQMQLFQLEAESDRTRAAYGDGGFADACLVARNLVTRAKTPFVEINLNGWDTHDDNFARVADLCGQMDQPISQLLDDLDSSGKLDETLVVWLGEFGRTPRVNARSGRDHFPKAFTVWLAGCGIQGGQTIGQTDKTGSEIIDRPISIDDLLQTVYHALGIDANEEYMDGERPLRIVEKGAPIAEAFA